MNKIEKIVLAIIISLIVGASALGLYAAQLLEGM